MDSPQPEEDDVMIALDPLDVVERVLMAENLSFDRTEDGDLAFTLAGDWKDYELWFAWRPEADCLQLCLSIDRRVEKDPTGRRLRAGQSGQPARLGGSLRGVGATTARWCSATPWPCRKENGRPWPRPPR